MKNSLLIPLFFFLLLTIPCHAYITLESNTSITYNEQIMFEAVDCVNESSGSIGCYLLWQDTTLDDFYLNRFNSTWQNSTGCTLFNNGQPTGLAVINESMAMVSYYNLSDFGDYCGLWNISNISSCTLISINESGCAVGQYGQNFGSWNGSYVFFGSNSNYLNLAYANSGLNYWYNGYDNAFALPDKTDDTIGFSWRYMTNTLPSTMSDITQWNSEVNFSTIADINELYGINLEFTVMDIVEYENYYRLYAADMNRISSNGYQTDFFYIANFSKALEVGQDILFRAVSPANTTTYNSEQNLVVSLTSELNGTIYFYLDDVITGIVTVNETTSNDQFSAITDELTSGQSYTWYAIFIDQYSNAWTTGETVFTYNLLDGNAVFNQPANAIAALIGNAFGIGSLSTSQEIAAIMLSLIIAVAAILSISQVGKGKLATSELMTMFAFVFMSALLMFTLAGWFNTFFLILLMVIAAFAFVKMGNLGGG